MVGRCGDRHKTDCLTDKNGCTKEDAMGFNKAKRLGLKLKGKPPKRKKIDLSKPLVVMTPAEQEYADSVIREHFDEDRTEIVSNVRFDARHTK
jgi:hypothetical protein